MQIPSLQPLSRVRAAAARKPHKLKVIGSIPIPVTTQMQLAIKTDAVLNDPIFRQFNKFVNSLRCPLCGSQLDGNVHPKEARLYCVSNNDEYICKWLPGDDTPASEILRFWYPQYEYDILITRYGSSNFRTQIVRFNLDVLPIYKNTTRKEMFDFTGDRILFFRNRMEEDVFLRKLKLYNVFS